MQFKDRSLPSSESSCATRKEKSEKLPLEYIQIYRKATQAVAKVPAGKNPCRLTTEISKKRKV